jgi:hypothetical protein
VVKYRSKKNLRMTTFLEKNKLLSILSPSNAYRCSILLKRTEAKISYINDQRSNLEYKKEKAPDED